METETSNAVTTADAVAAALPECRSGPPLGAVCMRIPSDPRHLRVVRDVVGRLGEFLGFSEENRFQMQLAVDEALTNIIRHAYQDRRDGVIELSFLPMVADRCALAITIRDFGKAVDPACIKSRELDDFRPGGLGVHIIRSVMDEVEYCPLAEGGMRLKLLKYV